VIHAVTHGAIHSLCSCAWPHAQYDFTTSSPSLEIPFSSFFFHPALSPPFPSCQCALAVFTLKERQVHDLVILFFAEWFCASLRPEGPKKHPVRGTMCLSGRQQRPLTALLLLLLLMVVMVLMVLLSPLRSSLLPFDVNTEPGTKQSAEVQ